MRRTGSNVAEVWRETVGEVNGFAIGRQIRLDRPMIRFFVVLCAMCLLACQPAARSETDAISQPVLSSDLFIRIIKTTAKTDRGVLQTWKRGENGQFYLDREFEICTWSGALGPKLKEGDGQSPEGFYFVRPSSMNPNSNYHLSFNLGFPNAFDRAHGRTGSFLMVHGACSSIGCYAMTNDGIDEIYSDVEAAFSGGQSFVRVHIFPFEMTEENLAAQIENPNYAFWANLKTGWDWFETKRRPPDVTVADKTYKFSAAE